MGREIKFRAWNPNTKQMVSGIEEINLGSGVVGEVSNGQLNITYQDSGGEWREANVMQYTGLRDKNGMEIYEGDILQLFAEFDEGYCPYHKTRVTFENGGFCLRDPFEYGDTPIFIHNFLEDMCNGVEVIGNIYENADLLNQ